MAFNYQGQPDDTALLNADRPVILAENLLRDHTEMKWTLAKSYAAASNTDANTPTTLVADGYTHEGCQSASNISGAQYFLIWFSATTVFDSIWIAGHNWYGDTVLIEAADDQTFTTNLRTLRPSGVWASDKPIVGLNFDSARAKVTGTGYIAITVTSGGANQPRIGELYLGKRIQLKHKSDRSVYYDLRETSRVAESESDSGVITRYSRAVGRRVLNLQLIAYESTRIADLKLLRTQAQQMVAPFVYWENPSTDEGDAPLMVADPEFPLRQPGPLARVLNLNAIEQGPDFLGGLT